MMSPTPRLNIRTASNRAMLRLGIRSMMTISSTMSMHKNPITRSAVPAINAAADSTARVEAERIVTSTPIAMSRRLPTRRMSSGIQMVLATPTILTAKNSTLTFWASPR